ncbi:unnamed protein product [Phytomonas sp. EM1]|nr:unnamed protein product [Phytomonas sp. EM1]|eukprot:CCW62192.1 unnamed protein product [Phytomonas sp. isolate EM1]
MSTAIQTVGGKQIIQLGSRLVVGIRVQGTIGHSTPSRPNHIKPRPYLHYLVETLKHLRCDVTLLFNAVGSSNEDSYIKQFSQRHFSLPFRYVFDEGFPHFPMTDRRLQRNARNYSDYFRCVCEEIQADPTRVLFIDSEINYRYPTPQVLILERFEPLKKRQQRERASTLPAHSDLLSTSQQRRRDVYQSGINLKISDIERKTAALQNEKNQNRKSDGDDYDERTMHFSKGGFSTQCDAHAQSAVNPGRNAAPHISSPSSIENGEIDSEIGVLGRRMMSRIATDAQRVKQMIKSKTPLAIDSVDLDLKFRPEVNSSSGEGASFPNAGNAINNEEKAASSDVPIATSLAINKEDFTLVALAEIIAELAASEGNVSDYLNTEVLVEKIKVPSHGVINYLPIENCDYINMLDWEHVRVEEKRRNDASVIPEVQEREEHKDLFK